MMQKVVAAALVSAASLLIAWILPAMWPSVDPTTGYWILAACITMLAAAAVFGYRPEKRPAKSEVTKTAIDQSVSVSGDNNGTIAPTYHNTINQAPAPEVRWGDQSATSLPNGRYQICIPLEIIAPYPVSEMWIEVYGRNVKSLELIPNRVGVQIMGHTGERPGFAFTSVQQASGRYAVRIEADDPQLQIKYGFA